MCTLQILRVNSIWLLYQESHIYETYVPYKETNCQNNVLKPVIHVLLTAPAPPPFQEWRGTVSKTNNLNVRNLVPRKNFT